MAAKQELKRTCRKCETVWYISTDELKGPSFSQVADVGFGIGKIHKRGKAVRDLHRESAERIKSLARCPQCRSTDYAETRV